MAGDIQKALNIEGWMYPAELSWLAEKAKESQFIIEIGSFKGRSTRALCDNTSGVVVAVDPYAGDYYRNDNSVEYHSGKDVMNEFYKNLKDHFISGKIIHIRGTVESLEMVDFADLVFIDADHRYEYIRNDILRSIPLLKKGGIISGHDYHCGPWPGVTKAVDELFTSGVNVIDTIWWKQL